MGKIAFKTSQELNLEISLNVVTDIASEIKTLNLDSFQLDMEKFSLEKKYLINERIYKFLCPEKPSMDSSSNVESNIADAMYYDVQK